MFTVCRLAVAAVSVALSFAAPAEAHKAGETIDLECPHPNGSRWRVLIDLDAEEARYRSVDNNGSSSEWQGPFWAEKHVGGKWIVWHVGANDTRMRWILRRSTGKLDVETATGGGCCASNPVKMTSIQLRCSTTKSMF